MELFWTWSHILEKNRKFNCKFMHSQFCSLWQVCTDCKVFRLWTQSGIVKENSQSTLQKYLPFSIIFSENASRKCLHNGTWESITDYTECSLQLLDVSTDDSNDISLVIYAVGKFKFHCFKCFVDNKFPRLCSVFLGIVLCTQHLLII